MKRRSIEQKENPKKEARSRFGQLFRSLFLRSEDTIYDQIEADILRLIRRKLYWCRPKKEAFSITETETGVFRSIDLLIMKTRSNIEKQKQSFRQATWQPYERPWYIQPRTAFREAI